MNKLSTLLILAVALALVAGSAFAAPANAGKGYKVNGDITLAPDADGDGIPNCQDPDYTPPADGSGSQFGKPGAVPTGAQLKSNNWFRYMWLGGIGPCVLNILGSSYGPGDGTGFDGDGPADGTGYGPGDGTGDCDGTPIRLRTHRP